MTLADITLILVVFAVVTGVVLVTSLLARRRDHQTQERLRELMERSGTGPPDSVSKINQWLIVKMGSIFPSNKEAAGQTQLRLVQAGFYAQNAVPLFMATRFLMIVIPLLVAFLIWIFGLVVFNKVAIWTSAACLFGWIAPGMWLDMRKRKRQTQFQRSLPDALDVIVICLEGGLSLRGALRRVVNELWAVHPLLADEMAIVEREILLGRTTGDALYEFAKRCDLEEVRSLASLVSQAEQFGTSMMKALTIYSDTLRLKRQQSAEEKAQKAATKIMFPTLLFIFPALFVVILGPAMIQLAALMSIAN